jgi:hypothetical protein
MFIVKNRHCVNDLLALDNRMFEALLQAMKDRAKEMQDASNGKRRHRTS